MRFSARISLCAILICLFCGTAVAGRQPFPMKTAWMGAHETFLVWYAVQKKWDRDVGLDVQLMRFESGRRVIDGVLAYNWAIAGCSAVSVIESPLNQQVCVIGIAGEASRSNALFTRTAHPILNSKGFNPDFPALYGTPETVKGKLVLCPRSSSAKYMLNSWLAALGMTEQDIRVRYMDPAAALDGFMNGVGDIIALWAPFTEEATRGGLQMIAQSADCDVRHPVLLLANRTFAREHPKEVAAFLKMYLRAVDTILSTPPDVLAEAYRQFFREWTGRTMDHTAAVRELVTRPVFPLSEQLALLAPEGGPQTLSALLREMVAIERQVGGRAAQNGDEALNRDFVTNRYLLTLKKKK